MKFDHYECDECGTRIRRITLHTSEMPGVDPTWEDLHFCGTLCMDSFVAHILNDKDISADLTEASIYWLKGQGA